MQYRTGRKYSRPRNGGQLLKGILKGLRPLSGVWGNAPSKFKEGEIKLCQTLYFKDKEMDNRSKIPPPELSDNLVETAL
jgi:hypothetical protein